MRSLAILLSFLVTIVPAAAEESAAPDFSGAWKRDCEKTYGLKIWRVEDKAYSVAFCFPAGCNDHAWIAKTPIVGDPKFKIISETEIALRRVDADGWLMYRRCSRDPASWSGTNQAEHFRQAGSASQ